VLCFETADSKGVTGAFLELRILKSLGKRVDDETKTPAGMLALQNAGPNIT
jgi:hypothetical protein